MKITCQHIIPPETVATQPPAVKPKPNLSLCVSHECSKEKLKACALNGVASQRHLKLEKEMKASFCEQPCEVPEGPPFILADEVRKHAEVAARRHLKLKPVIRNKFSEM